MQNSKLGDRYKKFMRLQNTLYLLVALLYIVVIAHSVFVSVQGISDPAQYGDVPIFMVGGFAVCAVAEILYICKHIYKLLNLWTKSNLEVDSLNREKVNVEILGTIHLFVIVVGLGIILTLAWNSYTEQLSQFPQYSWLFK